MIVEPGLGEALHQLEPPIAFLDFETVGLAIPQWTGCAPWQQVAAQFSCHVQAKAGSVTHHEWIGDGPEDPRPLLIENMIAACTGARTVVAYNVGFERGRIREMAEVFPEYAGALAVIDGKLFDLLPVVRNHVYHPDFGGSFSLKSVLPVLVPELSYDVLEVSEGGAASVELVILMFGGDRLSTDERAQTRKNLLDYCGTDTWGLLRMLERLKELAE
jgi:hypothetical protein